MSTEKDFEFNKTKGEVILLKYLGNAKKVIIPDEFEGEPVTSIGQVAFGQGQRLLEMEELLLPKHLEIIRESTFSSLKNLKKVHFPNNLKKIHSLAFSSCTSLEEVLFPASLAYVRADAFSNCLALKTVTAVSETTKISEKTFGKGEFLEEISFSLLKQLALPIQVRLLTEKIKNLSSLSEDEHESIKVYLKKKINLRKELFLHGSADSITFLLKLKIKLTLDQVEEYLEASISRRDTAVTAIFLNYKNNCFSKEQQDEYYNNRELVEIGLELPTLKQFEKKWNCRHRDGGIVISKYIGNASTEVIPAQLADGKKIIALECMKSSKISKIPTGSITHLTIEAPITTLPNHAFEASALEVVTLPDTIETIGALAFGYCSNLKTIRFPDNLKTFSNNMLRLCTSLEEITLPKHLETLESFAFLGCTSLRTVHFPAHEIFLDDTAFNNCKNFVDDHGFQIIQGVLYYYFGTDEVVVVPDSVTKIANSAFYLSDCKEVILPESVKIIGNSSFRSKRSLEKVTFPDSLKKIGNDGFALCPLLKEVTLPSGVKLGVQAFDENVVIKWK